MAPVSTVNFLGTLLTFTVAFVRGSPFFLSTEHRHNRRLSYCPMKRTLVVVHVVHVVWVCVLILIVVWRVGQQIYGRLAVFPALHWFIAINLGSADFGEVSMFATKIARSITGRAKLVFMRVTEPTV